MTGGTRPPVFHLVHLEKNLVPMNKAAWCYKVAWLASPNICPDTCPRLRLNSWDHLGSHPLNKKTPEEEFLLVTQYMPSLPSKTQQGQSIGNVSLAIVCLEQRSPRSFQGFYGPRRTDPTDGCFRCKRGKRVEDIPK